MYKFKKTIPYPPLAKGDLSLTTFTILLPISKEHLTENEIVEETSAIITEDYSPQPRSGVEHPASSIENRISSKQHPVYSILIVEDNPDVITYISSIMENDYNIITAINGELGKNKALEKFPDLIISDVMMPVMDGFELCQKLKSDQRTSHIPLILLTAKADIDSKVEGLELGADEYLTKPFEAEELLARVKNLIEQRRKLREHFQRELAFKPESVTVNSMDEQFLRNVHELVDQHIDDTGFSVGIFSYEIGMSRRHLNRKLQALTNSSSRDFIRTMRLKKAAQLLQQKSGSVMQIAYKVGFDNPSYFAICFRKQFGISPSQYTRQYL